LDDPRSMELLPQRGFSARLSRVYGGRHSADVLKELARDLRDQLGAHRVPVDLASYASLLRVRVEYRDIEADGLLTTVSALRRLGARGSGSLTCNVEGFLVDDSADKPVIVLRGSQKPGNRLSTRQRFTLAHEIGHFVIRRTIREAFPETVFQPDEPEEERCCNRFAAELLMPCDRLCTDLKHQGLTVDTLVRLSRKYDVSLQALLIRTAELFHKFAVLALHKQDQDETVLQFVAPYEFREMFLSERAVQTIRRAFTSADEEVGTYDVHLQGRRMRWQGVSKKLPGGNTVLTVMHRPVEVLAQYLPVRFRDSMPTQQDDSPQLSFEF
jgi:hypothetical protein